MKFISASISEKGPVRGLNADALLADDTLGFYAIADAIGSNELSVRGSNFAVAQSFEKFIEQKANSVDGQIDLLGLIDSVSAAYQRQFSDQPQSPSTTLTILHRHANCIRYVSVGDSPVFLVSDGHARLLTKHHTIVDRDRVISDFNDLKYQSGSNILFNTIGRIAPRPIMYDDLEIVHPCRVVMCSDGLMEFTKQRNLSEINSKSKDSQAFCRILRNIAKNCSPPDNYTAIIIDIS